MGNMDGPLGNATPTTSWHQLHWWKSPRCTVVRIEALTVVAIIISFFLAAFGSCRRWSNSWIVQKGFFAAQVLSLSLGTYSIGLMQSSSVKSEMYPVWTVSLFTLFGCIDPVTTYNGLDYKGPLSKVVFGICLNCGYVLLMSISSITNVIGKAAIFTLSAITFIKGFHRSFALVQQNKIRDMVYVLGDPSGEIWVFKKDENGFLNHMIVDHDTKVSQGDIEVSIRNNNDERLQSCYDMCVALCLSHKLQSYFLGLDYRVPRPSTLKDIDFQWASKVIEIELAFVYDAFFTGNPFLHYYQAKTACLWALASFAGICFVLVATAIPGGMTRRLGDSGSTKVVDTIPVDLAITFGILVSLALLQLLQLVRSWTSNWARAAVACAYAGKEKSEVDKMRSEIDIDILMSGGEIKILEKGHSKLSGWMRLKVFVATSTNLFDKYLWQDKISQYSILPEPRLLAGRETKGERMCRRCVDLVHMFGLHYIWQMIWELFSSDTNKRVKNKSGDIESEIEAARIWSLQSKGEWKRRRYGHLVQTLGLHYIWQVILELLSSDTNKRGAVKLDEDMKVSVIEFIGQIKSDQLDDNWLSSLPEQQGIRHFLPHVSDPLLLKPEVNCHRYTICVMTWHIATWYCEVAEQTNYFQRSGGGETKTRDHRRVANALSQYCVYLVKSAPELLPGPVVWTKRVYDRFVEGAKELEGRDKDALFENMPDPDWCVVCTDWRDKDIDPVFQLSNGKDLATLLMRRPDEIWKTLALVWVQLLVYAAPYGNAEAHMKHLTQGGEFITHLWALLCHLDIRRWKVQENLAEIDSMEDAERVLAEDDQAVVANLFMENDTDLEEFAAASRLVDGVRYYYICKGAIFEHLVGSDYIRTRELVFMKREGNSHKHTFYGGEFRAYDIARFVIENKIAPAHHQAQAQRFVGIERTRGRDLVSMKGESNSHEPTFYDGKFRANDIARFVNENKIAPAHHQAQAQVTPPQSLTFGNPTMPSRHDIAECDICSLPPPIPPPAHHQAQAQVTPPHKDISTYMSLLEGTLYGSHVDLQLRANFAEPVAHVPTWSVAIADDSPTPPPPPAPATPIPTTTSPSSPPLDHPVPEQAEHEQRNPGQVVLDEAAGALQLPVIGGAEPPVHGPSSPALLQQGVPVFSFGAGSEEHKNLAPKRRARRKRAQDSARKLRLSSRLADKDLEHPEDN